MHRSKPIGGVVLGGGLAALLAAWRLGCTEPHQHPSREASTSSQAVAPLSLTWGRCVEVRGSSEPTCIFDPEHPFHLWIDHDGSTPVEVFVDGRAHSAERYQAPEMTGMGLRLSLPPSARKLEVQVVGTTPWSLVLQSTHAPDALADEVAAIDEQLRRAHALYTEGQLWAAGKAAADQAIARALAAELTSKALDAALMSVFYLGWHVERPDLARQILDEMRPVALRSPQGTADWDASSGHVLWGQGEVSEAARAYREASRHAVRVEDERLVVEAMPMYAAVLAELGYFRAAARWSRYALDFVEPGSESHGQVLETAGWVNLMLRRNGREHADPIALYEQAVRIFGPQGSFPAPSRIGAARLGLAEARLLTGELEAALAQLQPVVDELLTLDDRAYRHDLELRIRLQRGDSGAELSAGLARLERAVAAAASPEARWWLAMRRGDVLVRAGQREAAVAEYRAAEAHLDELAQLAAFGVGRWSMGESRRVGAVRLAETLLELGRADEALCVLREAEGRRARLPLREPLDPELRAEIGAYVRKKTELDDLVASSAHSTVSERLAVEQRVARELEALRATINAVLHHVGRRWGRPHCTELEPRLPGELILGLYPGGAQWLVLAQDDVETKAHRIPTPAVPRSAEERERLAAVLLTPIDTHLARARRLRVLASGDAGALDVQTLPWRGQPLLHALTIVHGAELPGAQRPWPASPRALLVADPTHGLAGAEREIATAARALQRAGYAVDVLPPERARATEARAAIEGANLLHFSGHSRYFGLDDHGLWPPYAGGAPGMPSHLVLADGQQLAVHDVLLFDTVPEVVVLNGCQAGALDPGEGGTTLARAFLAGGSRVVIASPDVLSDDLAAMLGEGIYDDVDHAGRFDAAQALQRAQLALWSQMSSPEASIGRYRAWVP